jgi:site-specific recombinase XerD
MLGHASIEATAIYVHEENQIEEAAERFISYGADDSI